MGSLIVTALLHAGNIEGPWLNPGKHFERVCCQPPSHSVRAYAEASFELNRGCPRTSMTVRPIVKRPHPLSLSCRAGTEHSTAWRFYRYQKITVNHSLPLIQNTLLRQLSVSGTASVRRPAVEHWRGTQSLPASRICSLDQATSILSSRLSISCERDSSACFWSSGPEEIKEGSLPSRERSKSTVKW